MDAIHQLMTNMATDSRRMASILWRYAIECSRVKFCGRSNEITAANGGQHVVEGFRVGFFFGQGPSGNALAKVVTIGAKRRGIGGAGQGFDLLPFLVRRRQNLLGRARGCDKPCYQILM